MKWMLLVAAGLLSFGCALLDEDCMQPGDDCSEPTGDAGQSCADSDECEGWCEAPAAAELDPEAEITGTCSARTSAPCMSVVRDGRYGGTKCF